MSAATKTFRPPTPATIHRVTRHRSSCSAAAQALYGAAAGELWEEAGVALAQLARYVTAADAWADAGKRLPPCILPEQFRVGEYRAMCYPGNARHPVRERALPGPPRLRLVQGRFEPVDGFEGWFR
ncbi:MAG: hypothetical protein ACUVVU_09085 [Tepidimonas sp.]|uniref:hypothetical protein n=1 Tax=Tepidimonas sp. TaxID=2002775 RepID=UPI00405520A4